MHKIHQVLSLFSGAGALDYGFELTSRFATTVAIEQEPVFCQTLVNNQKRGFLKDAKIVTGSVSELSPQYVRECFFKESGPDGIIGGPPCESFSVMGNRRGVEDIRGSLIFSFAEWVTTLKPRFFLMENVPRLVTVDSGQTLAKLVSQFALAGYRVSHRILSAADYGAPTIRKRLFVVGLLGCVPFKFPEPTHSQSGEGSALRHCDVRQALSGLGPPSEKPPGVPQGHILIRHSPAVVDRFSRLAQGERDNIRKRNRLHLDKPSPTLVAGNLEQTRSHIHPVEPRELSNRESARLHGFPDNFIFAGNHAAMGKQIANSVPVSLARSIASAIDAQLAENKEESMT